MLFLSSENLVSFSGYLHFCPDIMVMQENTLTRKLRKISKFMTPQAETQIITINILPNGIRQ